MASWQTLVEKLEIAQIAVFEVGNKPIHILDGHGSMQYCDKEKGEAFTKRNQEYLKKPGMPQQARRKDFQAEFSRELREF